jgi:hypothetical protein
MHGRGHGRGVLGRNAANDGGGNGKGFEFFKGLMKNWKWSDDSRRIEWVEYVCRE